MTLSDPIADFLTRLRNAGMAKHRYTDIRFSKMKQNLAEIMKQQGFIENYMVRKDGCKGTIRLMLKYSGEREPVIRGLKRMSKPSKRKYVGHQEIPRVFGGMGIAIVSTSQGIIDGEKARRSKIGGELLCVVW
jgi:small subunit ribosomal protein S8